ncbi:MAG: creatininase family protein [Chloroflexi bacterium]|nr:creatininase family protein [Chloroflexota bacterium]
MLLSEMTWQEVAAYLENDDRIIVPIGSTEQHGPRAVIGTDYLVPDGIAAEAGRRAGVVAAPVIPYGMALHHMAFPGTISLRPSTLLRVVYDVLASLSRHGFRRVLILNGHGGNTSSLMSGVAEANDVYDNLLIKTKPWWDLASVLTVLAEAFGDRDGAHGTAGETSLVMALHPGIVSEEPVEMTPLKRGDIWPHASRWAERYPDGSAGADVNLASAEWGQRLFEAAVTDLVQELDRW